MSVAQVYMSLSMKKVPSVVMNCRLQITTPYRISPEKNKAQLDGFLKLDIVDRSLALCLLFMQLGTFHDVALP